MATTTIRIEDEREVRVPVSAQTVEQVGDLLEGRRPGKPSALIPDLGTIVPTVDSTAGSIVADPPKALLQ